MSWPPSRFLLARPVPPGRSRGAGHRARRPRPRSACSSSGRATIPTAKACARRPAAWRALSRSSSRGYETDPVELLQRTFEETEGYDEMVVLRDIRFESHCEHHMAPIIGKAHVAYLPNRRVVGISKLARLVEVYSRRLQIQEKMTVQVANTLNDVLQPKGVGVVIEAAHQCMTTRGIHKPGVSMVTSHMLGAFRDDPSTRREFLAFIGGHSAISVGNV